MKGSRKWTQRQQFLHTHLRHRTRHNYSSGFNRTKPRHAAHMHLCKPVAIIRSLLYYLVIVFGVALFHGEDVPCDWPVLLMQFLRSRLTTENFPSPNHMTHLVPSAARLRPVIHQETMRPGHQEKPRSFPQTSSPIPKPRPSLISI